MGEPGVPAGLSRQKSWVQIPSVPQNALVAQWTVAFVSEAKGRWFESSRARYLLVMQVRNGIPGWFNFSPFYDEMVDHLPQNSHIVEVGVLFGCSSVYLASRLKQKGKHAQLDLVDTFDINNLGTEGRPIADKHGGFRQAFETYRRGTDLDAPNVRVLQMKGVSAAWQYDKESLDFVFLDGDHSTENVRMEIEAFKPRIKKGGILAGHDIVMESVRTAVLASFPTISRREGNIWFKKIE